MKLLLYLIMILAAIGMVVGFTKDRRGVEWGKPLTVICAVVALLCASLTFVQGNPNKKLAEKYAAWEMEYRNIVGQKVGQYMAGKLDGGQVLVISDGMENTEAYIEGLKQGFGDTLSVGNTVVPDVMNAQREMMLEQGVPPEEIPETLEGMPMDPTMVTASMLDDVIDNAEGDYAAVVSLIGLPYDYLDMDFWRDRDHPPFVSMAAYLGMPLPELKSMIKVDHILAVVFSNPEGEHKIGDIPEGLDEAFNKRFLLVTPENVDELAEKHSEFFPESE